MKMKDYGQLSGSVGYVRNSGVTEYCKTVPFDPPERYPELPFVRRINQGNRVYPMVRELLVQMGLDHQNAGTERWNPFKYIVRPGEKVLIKPNLVTHRHYLGRKCLYSTVVHGSIIRPIVDYVHLALQGRGTITIADNPIEGADFEKLMQFTGIKGMVDELLALGYADLRILDLRPRVLREDRKGTFYYESLSGDPLGYIEIDLANNSLFSEFDGIPGTHYYTLGDQTIDHFDPDCIQGSATDEYHNTSTHKYIVSKSVLDADVIMNVAKMKTHCKAGVTLALKNIVGIVCLKDCMPHHRPGMPPQGDSFSRRPASHYILSRTLYRRFRTWLRVHRIPGFRTLRNCLRKNGILIGHHIEHGNWKGNDTIWRTILDLNRIALYADKKGLMRETTQRRCFAIIDGIIAQQGDGPMNGEPKASSILFAGFNPILVDALAVKAMGIDYQSIKSIARAKDIRKWRLLLEEQPDLSFPHTAVPVLDFDQPNGWN